MVYPEKMHVRYSTVMVIVVLLMGSVLYEVTRTEALARQSAARTQDIALPAPQPVTHTVRPYTNFIGSSSAGRSAIQPFQPNHELLASAAYGSVTVVRAAYFQRAYASRGLAAAFNGRSFINRGRSSGGTGYAAGYGMGGVGAWGGVSGMMRPNAPSANLAERPARRAAQAARTPAPRRNNNGSGGSGGATSGGGSSAGTGTDSTGASLPPGGFTTGAAAVEPGAVAGVGAAAAPAPSPAPTPEPMSLLLVGGGLAALYKVRQRLQ